MKMKFGIKEVVATGIGTALFVALTEVQIPLGFIPNTALQPRAALLAFLAAVFGPVVGGIVGLLGHAIGDALFYGSVWWSWVFPDAVFGILVGLFAAKYAIKDGGFEKKQIVLFNVVQVVANLAAWVIVAPVLDIVIYAEPANKVFAQGAWACLGNVIIIGILGTLIAAGYSKIGAKSSSLSKEDWADSGSSRKTEADRVRGDGVQNVTGSAHFFFHLELLSSIIVGKYHKRGRRGFRNGTDHRISEFFF